MKEIKAQGKDRLEEYKIFIIIIIYLLTAVVLTPPGNGYIHVHKYKLGI